MQHTPLSEYGFSAQWPGASGNYEELHEFGPLDKYLRYELAESHPGWEPTYGQVSHYDENIDRRSFAYLVTGSVPGAKSRAEAEEKVKELVHRISERLKLPPPKIRTWKW